MTLQTNLSPYYDDYNEDKNFHRILFKPGVPVQARELTQAQTILQNQVQRIGNFLFTDGDKVEGPSIAVNSDARTVRLKDTNRAGQKINLSDLLNKYVVSPDSDIIGYVEFVFEKDNPNVGDPISIVISLKRYNQENDGKFESNKDLYFYSDYTDALNKITTNLTAVTAEKVVKNAFCTTREFRTEVILTNPSQLIRVGDFLVHPRLQELGKRLYVTEVRNSLEIVINEAPGVDLGNERIEFTREATCPTTIVTQDSATFYKDGFFVRNVKQKIVPDKDTAFPSKVVGFLTEQQIITSNDDNSLLDPALESSNYFAVGADRLKIDLALVSVEFDSYEPSVESLVYADDKSEEVLVSKPTTNRLIYNSENFIPIVKFNKGDQEYVKKLSVNSTLDQKLAERTYEESGSYVVEGFQIIPSETTEENENLIFNVNAGTSYIGGYRVATVGPSQIEIPKNTKTEIIQNYNINTAQGNYIKVNKVLNGLISQQNLVEGQTKLELHNVVNPVDETSKVGTLYFKSMEYETYSGQLEGTVYKLFYYQYLPEKEIPPSWPMWATRFNVPEEEGRLISSILYESNDALYSVTNPLTNQVVTYYGLRREPDAFGLAFWHRRWVELGKDIEKIKVEFVEAALADPFDGPRVTNNTKTFYSVQNGSPFIDGIVGVTKVKSVVGLTGGSYGSRFFYAEIPASGLDKNDNIVFYDTKVSDILIFPTNKTFVKTVSRIQTSYFKTFKNVAFTGGVYTKNLSAPETFALGSGSIPPTTARTNFILLIKTGATDSVPLGVWPFENGTVIISGADSSQLTINTGDPSFEGTADISILIENEDTPIRTKTIVETASKLLDIEEADLYYSTGISDVISYSGIYKLETPSLYKGDWDGNQNYDYLDLVTFNNFLYECRTPGIALDPSYGNVWSSLTSEPLQNFVLNTGQTDNYYNHGAIKYIGPSSDIPGNVLVTFSYFEHSGEGPLTVNSYPEDLYSLIPNYRSVVDARNYNLRDCLDFRPRRIDNSVEADFGSSVIPASYVNTEANIEYYIGRKDRIYVTKELQNFDSPFVKFLHVKGVENPFPIEPEDYSDLTKLSLAVLTIPPFCVSSFEVAITYDDNARYTMKDIGRIEDITIKLEKAVRVHSIEIASLKSLIFNESGDTLFKTGILIEDFSDLDKVDLLNGFSAVIDEEEKECFPGFAAYNVNLDLIQDLDILIFNDLITMKYEEEVFISQLEASAAVNPNPGAVEDGKGRATVSKKNSFQVNLALAGGALLSTSITLKTVAAYYQRNTAIGGTFASTNVVDSFGATSNAIAYQNEAVLAIVWKSLIDINAGFLQAASVIDSVMKVFGSGLSKSAQEISRIIWETVTGGFGSVIDFLGVPEGLANTPTNNQVNSTLTDMSRVLTNIFQQPVAVSFFGVGNSIRALNQRIENLALISDQEAVARGKTSILKIIILTVLTAAAIKFFWPAVPFIIALAIGYAIVKFAKRIWRSIRKRLSDENTKENIEYIRTLSNGAKIYSYEYKEEYRHIGGYGKKYGYIAQQIENIYPKAVSVDSNGLKFIDYSLIGN